MNKSRIWLWLIGGWLGLVPSIVAGQEDTQTVVLTLKETVQIARQQSPQALIAKNDLRNSYWRYKSYEAKYLPQVNLEGTLPNLNRSIESITLPDGSEAFAERNFARSSLGMSVRQEIKWTGGEVYLNSDLSRLDVIRDSFSTSYRSNPLVLGYRQPILSFNAANWERKIQPLRLKQAKRQYVEGLEQVSIEAVRHFFDYYIAKMNLKIARQNLANADTLYKITNGRYDLGKIAEDELLQMELNKLDAETALERAKLDLKDRHFKLRSFLGYSEGVQLRVLPPKNIPQFKAEVQKAINQAQQHQNEMIKYKRQLLEAERDVTRAKRENGFNANFFAQFGLTNRGEAIEEIYSQPRDQQNLQIGIQVPILDWGEKKAQVAMARAHRKLTKTTVKQNRTDLKREVSLFVNEFNIAAQQLEIAAKADTIAQKRYKVAKYRYTTGKIDVTDLNNAQTEKDRSRRSYLQQLKNYWIQYYKLRKMTHYDFHHEAPIEMKEINYWVNETGN